jgi:hypothetical protein
MKSSILLTWEFRHPPNNQDENVEDFGRFFMLFFELGRAPCRPDVKREFVAANQRLFSETDAVELSQALPTEGTS